ncbi:phaC PHA synthase [Fusobacterium sp.]|uniref:LA_2272 family surface repeat-containing protein n=1 Tax=Fusobacterium sp. TaxID=68766 RepID=UPI002605479F|nr:phaC PHA synthase [Fusobacterium sp.]
MNLKLLAVGTMLASTVAFGATKPAQFSVFPGVQFGATKYDSISNFSFNLLGAENQNVSGLDLSLIGYRQVNGNFNGFHAALFGLEAFRVRGNMSGVSIALWNDVHGNLNGGTIGVVNTTDGNSVFNFGGVNITRGTATVQIGFVNYAESTKGLQLGFVNATRNLDGVQVGLVNYATNGIFPVLPIVNFRKSF